MGGAGPAAGSAGGVGGGVRAHFGEKGPGHAARAVSAAPGVGINACARQAFKGF